MTYLFTNDDHFQMSKQGWPVAPKGWHDILSYHTWTCTWIYAQMSPLSRFQKNIEGVDYTLSTYIIKKNSEMVNPMPSFTNDLVTSNGNLIKIIITSL